MCFDTLINFDNLRMNVTLLIIRLRMDAFKRYLTNLFAYLISLTKRYFLIWFINLYLKSKFVNNISFEGEYFSYIFGSMLAIYKI